MMQAQEVMTKDAITISRSATVADTVKLILRIKGCDREALIC